MNAEVKETETVTSLRVACDGGQGGQGGHPRVWLRIPADPGWIECPYCDKRYILAKGVGAGH